MNKLLILLCALVGASVLSGCGSSEASATKKEEDSFRNPPKEMPAAAQAAMANAGKQGAPPAAVSGGQ